jgi:Fe-S-cluster-containing hydrogenase component 2
MLVAELDRCNGCGACVESCPQGAPILKNGKAHFASSLCIGCQTCMYVCPTGAIYVSMTAASKEEALTGIPWTALVPDREQAEEMAEVELVFPHYRRW